MASSWIWTNRQITRRLDGIKLVGTLCKRITQMSSFTLRLCWKTCGSQPHSRESTLSYPPTARQIDRSSVLQQAAQRVFLQHILSHTPRICLGSSSTFTGTSGCSRYPRAAECWTWGPCCSHQRTHSTKEDPREPKGNLLLGHVVSGRPSLHGLKF